MFSSDQNVGQLLVRVNYPIYVCKVLTERHILVAGGGGQAKTGISNAIEIYELIYDSKTNSCRTRLVTRYDTGSRVVMNMHVIETGSFQYDVLCGGNDGLCDIYKLKLVIQDDDVKDQISGRNSPEKLTFKFIHKTSFQTDFHHEEPFQKVVKVHHESGLVVTGGSDGHIRCWSRDFKKKIDIKVDQNEINDLDISPDGQEIVAITRDGNASVWSTYGQPSFDGQPKCKLQFELPTKFRDSKYIFRACKYGVADDNKDAKLFTIINPLTRNNSTLNSFIGKWEINGYSSEKLVETGNDCLSTMSISDDGRFIGLGTLSGAIYIYIAFSLKKLYQMDKSHGIFVTGTEFLKTCSPTQNLIGGFDNALVSVSVDNQIIIHRIPKQSIGTQILG